MMVIMVLGADGQLGTAIKRKVVSDPHNHWHFLSRAQLDIRNKDEVINIAASMQPHIMINCAAMTNVDNLEKNKEEAFAVNAYGAAHVAEAAVRLKSKLIHISTDYVFDGNGIVENGQMRPYRETDNTAPLSIYGESKLLGEKLIQSGNSRHMIIRTSWLYGGRNDFVSKIIRQAYSGKTLQVVSDQVGSPTSADALASAIIKIMITDYCGLYHGTCSGQVSRFDFARYILQQIGLKNQVIPVLSSQFLNTAKRPAFSALDNARFNGLGVYQFNTWETALINDLKIRPVEMIISDLADT